VTETPETPPAREIIIARHGHAHCNEHRIIAGPACKGLTDNGRAQANALGQRLADRGGITAIHASTTPRALETAHIAAQYLGLPVQEEPDLRVPDPGDAEGWFWPDARTHWPLDPDYPTRPLAGGETWRGYLARSGGWLDELISAHPGGRVLIVGHTETGTAMLSSLLGVLSLHRMYIHLGCCKYLVWRCSIPRENEIQPIERWALCMES
jgi:probable phosphoglycerate mutase